MPQEEPYQAKNEKEEKIKNDLLAKYGFTRLKNRNIYDTFDVFNVETNLLEISTDYFNIL